MRVSKKDFDTILESVGYTSKYLPNDSIDITCVKTQDTTNFCSQEEAIRYLDSKGLFETEYLTQKLSPDTNEIKIPDYKTALRVAIENEQSSRAKAISTYMFLMTS